MPNTKTGESGGGPAHVLYAPDGTRYTTDNALEANRLRSHGYSTTKPKVTAEVRAANEGVTKRTARRGKRVAAANQPVAEPVAEVPDPGPTAD